MSDSKVVRSPDGRQNASATTAVAAAMPCRWPCPARQRAQPTGPTDSQGRRAAPGRTTNYEISKKVTTSVDGGDVKSFCRRGGGRLGLEPRLPMRRPAREMAKISAW